MKIEASARIKATQEIMASKAAWIQAVRQAFGIKGDVIHADNQCVAFLLRDMHEVSLINHLDRLLGPHRTGTSRKDKVLTWVSMQDLGVRLYVSKDVDRTMQLEVYNRDEALAATQLLAMVRERK